MGNLGHSWSHQSNTCSFLVVIISLNLALLSSNSGVLAAFGRQEENNLVAAACLKTDTSVSVTCPSSNQKIKILSVAYAYLENCNTPVEFNECKQLSTHLSQRAQTQCDGKVNCQVPVVQVNQANSGSSQPLGSQESIQFQLVRCGYNKILQDTARMTSMVVTYQCQALANTNHQHLDSLRLSPDSLRSKRNLFGRDAGGGSSNTANQDDKDKAFEFCNDIDEEVQDLTMSTANFPVTSVSNPTCECTFETMDPGAYYLTGFAHCNGSVVFVTEETLHDGIVEKFEYPCENALNEIIYIGNTQPVKIKLTIDAEKSGEESAYKITWFNQSPRDGTKASNAHTKVTCEAGSLWLPYTTKLILMIVIPLACVVLIALIILYCIIKKRRKRRRRGYYKTDQDMMMRRSHMDTRTDPAADGKSSSSVYDPQERSEWCNSPDLPLTSTRDPPPSRPVASNKPQYKQQLSRSHSAIPATRNNDLAMSAGDLRLSRSRQSVRSTKRQAPRPPGPPATVMASLPAERRALLHNNIEHGESSGDVDTEPVHRRALPSAPSVTPPPDMFRGSYDDLPPPPPPIDHTSPMLPYRRKHSKRKSLVESPRREPSYSDPAAPLSIIALDESYTQPPASDDGRRLSRRYNTPSPMAFDHDDENSLSPSSNNNPRRKQSASPQSSSVNNQSTSDNESGQGVDNYSHYNPDRGDNYPSIDPGEDYTGHDPDWEDTDDDMLIMRPAKQHHGTPTRSRRGKQKPFKTYTPQRRTHKDSINSNDAASMTYFNPGDED